MEVAEGIVVGGGNFVGFNCVDGEGSFCFVEGRVEHENFVHPWGVVEFYFSEVGNFKSGFFSGVSEDCVSLIDCWI